MRMRLGIFIVYHLVTKVLSGQLMSVRMNKLHLKSSAWLKDHDTSPVTNLPMPDKRLQSMPDAAAFTRRLVAELSSNSKKACREQGLCDLLST